MADAALRQLWASVRRDFDRARALLSSAPTEGEGSMIRLDDWLSHNELGLALEELEALGVDNAAPPELWEALASAADRMGLTKLKARLTARCICDSPERNER